MRIHANPLFFKVPIAVVSVFFFVNLNTFFSIFTYCIFRVSKEIVLGLPLKS